MASFIQCPACESKLSVDADLLPRKVRCAACGQTFATIAGSQSRGPMENKNSDVAMPSPLSKRARKAESSEADASSAPSDESNNRSGGNSSKDVEQFNTGRMLTASISRAIDEAGTKGTRVNAFVAAILGGVATIGLVVLLLPLIGTRVGQIVFKSGLIPFLVLFLSFWSLAILFLKRLAIRKQTRPFGHDLLPSGIADAITPENIPAFLQHLASLPKVVQSSLLVHRIRRALKHFGYRASVEEVGSFLNTQSEIDSNRMFSSYRLVKVCVWAIPILGFVGTVQGIGSSVAGFASTVNATQDLDAMKNSLGVITSGLGLAFDTTLLALVMSMFVVFPMNHLQKNEEDLLSQIDDYCSEHLSQRLNNDDDRVASDLEAFTNQLSRLIVKQQQQVTQIAEQTALAVGRRMAALLESSHQRTVEANGELLVQSRNILQDSAKQAEATIDRFANAHQSLSERFDKTSQSVLDSCEQLSQYLASIEPLTRDGYQQLEVIWQGQQDFVSNAAGQLNQISNLGSVLCAQIGDASERLAEVGAIRLEENTEMALQTALNQAPRLTESLDRVSDNLQNFSVNGKPQKRSYLSRILGMVHSPAREA